MKSKKIYEKSFRYGIVHNIMKLNIHASFKRFECVGLENIPKDGAVILAPNHCNTLMDPLALLSVMKTRMVFVARADIFKSKIAAKFLNFLKIMPIVRKRDGIRNVLQTDDTIKKSIEVLNNHVPFCILPEGTHRTMHSLLPIGKGIARIALGADEQMPGENVYIVPVGLEYGDYFRYRSTLRIEFGEPINVTSLVSEMEGGPNLRLYNKIRSLTAEGIRDGIVYIPDDENYEAVWTLARIASGKVPETDVQGRWSANREAAEKLRALAEKEPERASALFGRAVKFDGKRKAAGVSLHVLNAGHPFFAALLRTLVAILWAPLAIVQTIAGAPVWAFSEFLCSKAEDSAFHNSLRCSVVGLWGTVVLVIWAVVLFLFLPVFQALMALVIVATAPFVVYDYKEWLRRTVSAWRSLGNKKIITEYRALCKEIEKL